MMKFVDRVTPDNVAVAMPQYNPAGAPKFIPSVKAHGVPEAHGAQIDTHGAAPVDTHGVPVETHGTPVVVPHEIEIVPHEPPAGH
jgi:hypothetical protein